MQELIGTGVALVTPFTEELTVDFDALQKLVEYNIENGTNYLVVNGTTGESATITQEEKAQIIKTVIATNAGRLPIVLGVGGNNTQTVVEELQTRDFTGIDAILSVAPYYSKPTQEGLYQHFKAVAQASPRPIILYNVPGRTAKNMEPATTLRLARDFENVVAVKEAGNHQQQYLELLKDKPEDFLIISGDDDLALGVALAGGAGVISVLGQALPKQFCHMIQLGLQGQAKEAYDIHFKLMDITGYIFEENNPAGVKAVLQQLGICTNAVRLPLVPATTALEEKITSFLDNL